MSNTHTSIHDNFIRVILASKSIATEYFRNYLPEHISAKLNFPTLTQIPDTYLSVQLRKSISDIVFSCEKNNTSGQVKICLLLEHKDIPISIRHSRSAVTFSPAYKNRSKIKKNFRSSFLCCCITGKVNGDIKQ